MFPAILVAAALSQALPPLAGLRYGRAIPPARRWIIAWAATLLAVDVIAMWTASRGLNNLWTGYVFTPVEVVLALLGLATWHTGAWRTAIRAAVPAFLLTAAILVLTVENTDQFSTISDPLKSILILTACIVTILVRIRTAEGSLLHADWFWSSVGLALRYGCAIGIGPLSSLLVDQSPETVAAVWKIESVVDLIASFVIAGGILCPIPPRRPSSGSSSPASSPSPSFSPPSAPPW
jgi:hypothetical protein